MFFFIKTLKKKSLYEDISPCIGHTLDSFYTKFYASSKIKKNPRVSDAWLNLPTLKTQTNEKYEYFTLSLKLF